MKRIMTIILVVALIVSTLWMPVESQAETPETIQYEYITGVLKGCSTGDVVKIQIGDDEYGVTDDCELPNPVPLGQEVILKVVNNKVCSIQINHLKNHVSTLSDVMKTDVIESVSYGVAKYKNILSEC